MPKTVTSPVEKFTGTVILFDPLPLPAVLAYEESRARVAPHYCPEAWGMIVELPESKRAVAKDLSDLTDKEKKDRTKTLSALASHQEECKKCRSGLLGTAANIEHLNAILPCVMEWHLDGVPETPNSNTFPGSPREESTRLIDWLIKEIGYIYTGEVLQENDPNA